MLDYRNQDFAYENHDEPASEYRLDRSKKDYSRSRSLRSLRKRARGRTGYSGCGMAARRNKRMAW